MHREGLEQTREQIYLDSPAVETEGEDHHGNIPIHTGKCKIITANLTSIASVTLGVEAIEEVKHFNEESFVYEEEPEIISNERMWLDAAGTGDPTETLELVWSHFPQVSGQH